MLEIKKYDLPDFNIYESDKNTFRIWHPEETYVVLGTSNKPDDALNERTISDDNIQVYKRPSGGQSVVLTPNTIVIAVLKIETEIKAPKIFFHEINSLIISALEEIGVENLSHKGISDIAIGEKKILGSSMYRNKEKNFYHAVLNVSESANTFEKYLKHPVKEPDYRKGRPHKDFVTSLKECRYVFSANQIAVAISRQLQNFTTTVL
jgi:lipoate-protein ligase A